MDFNKALGTLQELHLPEDKFTVVGSATLAIYGIRKANDLDVIVTDELWQSLATDFPVTHEPPCDRINLDGVEILGPGSMYRNPEIATVDEIIETADLFDNIRFINLELLRKFKYWRGHKKDLEDIQLIDLYVKIHPIKSVLL